MGWGVGPWLLLQRRRIIWQIANVVHLCGHLVLLRMLLQAIRRGLWHLLGGLLVCVVSINGMWAVATSFF
jgi:hypothetical protein